MGMKSYVMKMEVNSNYVALKNRQRKMSYECIVMNGMKHVWSENFMGCVCKICQITNEKKNTII